MKWGEYLFILFLLHFSCFTHLFPYVNTTSATNVQCRFFMFGFVLPTGSWGTCIHFFPISLGAAVKPSDISWVEPHEAAGTKWNVRPVCASGRRGQKKTIRHLEHRASAARGEIIVRNGRQHTYHSISLLCLPVRKRLSASVHKSWFDSFIVMISICGLHR